MVPIKMALPDGSTGRSGARSRMGRNEPSEALMASTSVLAREIPVALTPWPNMIAPKPQANPVTRATTMARPGAALKACRMPETVATVMITGMATQETKMKMDQTFSHEHRPRKRIGNVNVPFLRHGGTARETTTVRSELG